MPGNTLENKQVDTNSSVESESFNFLEWIVVNPEEDYPSSIESKFEEFSPEEVEESSNIDLPTKITKLQTEFDQVIKPLLTQLTENVSVEIKETSPNYLNNPQ